MSELADLIDDVDGAIEEAIKRIGTDLEDRFDFPVDIEDVQYHPSENELRVQVAPSGRFSREVQEDFESVTVSAGGSWEVCYDFQQGGGVPLSW